MFNELLIAMFIVLFLMISSAICVLSFLAGFIYKGKKKPISEHKKPTEEDIRKAKRMQKEVENFMAYNGTPQDAID